MASLEEELDALYDEALAGGGAPDDDLDSLYDAAVGGGGNSAFNSWYAERASRLGLNPNPDDPLHQYDYRAAFAAGAEPDASGHWPSEFKKAGHPNRYVDGVDTITGRPAWQSAALPDDQFGLGSLEPKQPTSTTPTELAETGSNGLFSRGVGEGSLGDTLSLRGREFAHRLKSAAAQFDYVPGLIEEGGRLIDVLGGDDKNLLNRIVPQGTVKGWQESLERERVDLLAQIGEKEGDAAANVAAAQIGMAEVAANAIPIAGLGRAARLLLGGNKGAAAGYALGFGEQFIGSTAGRSAEERMDAIKDPRLLAAAVIGGGAETHAAFKSAKAARLDDALRRKKAAEADAALDAIAGEETVVSRKSKADSLISGIDEIRLAAEQRRIVEDGERIKAAVDDAGVLIDQERDLVEMQQASLGLAERAESEALAGGADLAAKSEAIDTPTGVLQRESLALMDRVKEQDLESTRAALDDLADADQWATINALVEKEADAVLSGDVSKLGDVEAFAAARVKALQDMDAIRERSGALKAETEQALRNAQSVEQLREIRAVAARKAGADPEFFAKVDEAYQRVADDVPEVRDLGDAVSEYQAAITAIMPRVERMANRLYDQRLKKNGGQPLPISREEYVLKLTSDRQQRLNDSLAAVLQGTSDPSEAMRLLDAKFSEVLGKYKIRPGSVGFRGNRATRVKQAAQQADQWLAGKLRGRRLHELTDEDLLQSAKDASAQKAPLPVYAALLREASRRAKSEAPNVTPRTDGYRTPEEIRALLLDREQKLATDLELTPELEHYGNSLSSRLSYEVKKRFGRFLSLGSYREQVGRGKVGRPLSAPSLRDTTFMVANKRARKALLGSLVELPEKARAAGLVAVRQASVALSDLEVAVGDFVEQQGKAGVAVDPQKIYHALKANYEKGTLSALEPAMPGVVRVVREQVDPALERLGSIVSEWTDDPDLKEAIRANRGRYLYRYYNIFSDRSAVFKDLLTKSEPYRAFYEKVKDERFADFHRETYERVAPELRGRGLSENEILGVVELKTQERLHGFVSALVKQHLATPGSVPKTAKLLGALPDYDMLIKRVIEDPNLRELLGEEKHFALAVQTTIEKIASDMERQILHKSLIDAYKAAGMVSETAKPGIDVRIPKDWREGLLPGVEPDKGALYAHPEVATVMNALKNADPAIDGFNALTAAIKFGFIANIPNYLSQEMGMIQGVALAGGRHGIQHLFSTNDATGKSNVRTARMVAKELIHPGSAGKGLDPKARAEVRRLGNLYNGLALDQGGELVFELKLANRALQEGAEVGEGRVLKGKAARFTDAVGRRFRIPDVAVKVMTHMALSEEMLWKEGVSALSPAMEEEVMRRTLATVQDPRRTPSGVRNMSYSATGALMAGFHGFAYQTTRNIANSFRFAVKDAAHGAMLGKEAMRMEALGNVAEAEKLRAKARRYASSGAERAVATTLVSFAFGKAINYLGSKAWAAMQKLSGNNDGQVVEGDEQERSDAIRRFLYDESLNADTKVDHVLKQKDGTHMVSVTDAGRMNMYEMPLKILRALGTDGDAYEKLKSVANELRMQYLQGSFYWDRLREGLRGAGGLPEDPASVEGAKFFGKMAAGTVNRLAPTELRNVATAATDETKRESILFRHLTGAWADNVLLEKRVAGKYARDWHSAEGWVRKMREEYKEAGSQRSRLAVQAKYERQWKDLMLSFADNAGDAAAFMPQSAVERSLKGDWTDQKRWKEVGSLPHWMHPYVTNPKRATSLKLSDYLNKIKD